MVKGFGSHSTLCQDKKKPRDKKKRIRDKRNNRSSGQNQKLNLGQKTVGQQHNSIRDTIKSDTRDKKHARVQAEV